MQRYQGTEKLSMVAPIHFCRRFRPGDSEPGEGHVRRLGEFTRWSGDRRFPYIEQTGLRALFLFAYTIDENFLHFFSEFMTQNQAKRRMYYRRMFNLTEFVRA